MCIYTIYKKIWISASHKIESPGYIGQCSQLHGHNYKIEVWGTSTKLNEHGMVMDFNDIKKGINILDHQHLNDIMDTKTPTAEEIGVYILEGLETITENVNFRVRIWETHTSYCEVWSDGQNTV
jgi:6-pyruvoyltetrahydropterin/6-carboxytetrahydropterin synthase